MLPLFTEHNNYLRKHNGAITDRNENNTQCAVGLSQYQKILDTGFDTMGEKKKNACISKYNHLFKAAAY